MERKKNKKEGKKKKLELLKEYLTKKWEIQDQNLAPS